MNGHFQPARLVIPAIKNTAHCCIFAGYHGQTEGLAGNSKPIYEVCDSKSDKSAHMY